MPSRSQICFHITVVNIQISAWMKCDIVRVSKSTSDDTCLLGCEIVSNDRSTRCFDAFSMSTWIFKSRLDQVPFIGWWISIIVGPRLIQLRVVADHNVQTTVWSKRDLVRSVFPGGSLKAKDQLGLFKLTVSIGICKAVETGAFVSISSYIDIAVERQDPLNVLHKITVDSRFVERSVFIRIVKQQQRSIFLRSDNMPKLIECHCQDGTHFLGTKHFDDRETRLCSESIYGG